MLVKSFQEIVNKYGHKPAIKTTAVEHSFHDINNGSDKIAAAILARQVISGISGRPGVVSLLFGHGAGMIISLLGAIKSGNTYVPLDINYPVKRLEYILEDSDTWLIVTDNSTIGLAEKLSIKSSGRIQALNIDTIGKCDFPGQTEKKILENETAYIIYTSGSTGKPKGVYQSHRNINHFIGNYARDLNITHQDRLTLISAFNHDAAVMDIYAGLLTGATLFPLDVKTQLNDFDIADWLKKERISIYHSVPTLYRHFVGGFDEKTDFPDLRHIVLGGEAVVEHDVKAFKKHFSGATLMNLYGQSESSYNSGHFIAHGTNLNKVTLGKVTGNTSILVVDEQGGEVAPLGVGEIVVNSDHVALGYWKDPERTKKYFTRDEELGKLYWTGDLGRLQLDGSIEFMGRKDFQVKIRGFRVDLGEIESRLLSHPLVKQAAVIVKQDDEDNSYLWAYLTAKGQLTGGELRDHSAEELPDHMVPSYFIMLDEMPLTSTNKIDRHKLRQIQHERQAGKTVLSPRDETEAKLLDIWQEVLSVKEISISDNFFELGGHSLKAITLSSRVHRGLGKELPLRKIFEQPTIEGQGRYLREQGTGGYSGIEVVGKSEHYPVSASQRRLYVLEQFGGIGTSYNMTVALEVEGDLDKERLEESFKRLVERHESLRTSFASVEGEPVQTVWEEVPFGVEYASGREEEIAGIAEGFVRPFDLGKAPLLRAKVVEINDRKHALLVDMHHIISDGTSMGILIKDFVELYGGRELEGLKVQYKDYSAWQRRQLEGDEAKRHEEYWKETLGGELPVLNLPADHPRPGVQSFEGERISFRLSKDQSEGLKELGKRHGATLYMTLLSVYGVLLSKYSGQEDIIVGSPVAGREHAELEGVMGMFVNTLALRLRPEGDKSYVKYLAEVKEQALGGYAHQAYPFDHLVELLGVKRDLSRNPVFDTMFALQNVELPELEIAGLKFRPYGKESKISKFDLLMEAYEDGEEIAVEIEYCRKLFDRVSMELFGEHFKQLAESVLRYPNKAISELEMMGEAERQRILVEFNDTKTDYPKDKTIHQLFGEQAKLHGEKTALAYQGREVSYGELDLMSNKIAHRLRESGVTREDIVGIMADRSVEMVAGILGILKAGGAYLPVDPEYPEDRIRYMLSDSRAGVLLMQKGMGEISNYPGKIIDIGDAAQRQNNYINIKNVNGPQDLAYIIYTSGSTGNPKGAMVEHGNVVRLVKNTNYISFSGEDRILPTGALVFDASTFEIWGALLNGLQLYLMDKETILDAYKLEEIIRKNRITILWLTSALFNQLAQENIGMFKPLKYLLVGGDVVSYKYVNELRRVAGDIKVINGYGPTENTTFSTCFLIEKDYEGSIPIGSPISNSTAYILNSKMKLQAIGVPGELYVGGDGVSRGYLNNEELTRERFVSNPYMEGDRLYKTGDVVRWLGDGNIEFIGRKDFQIKLRGFRIELGEIEQELLKHSGVKEAIVTAIGEGGEYRALCAYVSGEGELGGGVLRSHLSGRLPDYMVPSYFVQMDRLPLTSNGKVDRKALPAPEAKGSEGEYVAPRDAMEKALAEIWSGVLGIDKVGINDNFFALGGHSLKATVLSSRVHRGLGKELPLRKIFEQPTIEGQGRYLREQGTGGYSGIEVVGKSEHYPVSASQRRLYVLEQFGGIGTSYNMTVALEVEGDLDKERLEESFKRLVERHESLRTSFASVEGEPVQTVWEEVPFGVEYASGREEEIAGIAEGFVRPFDLGKAPLLRAKVVEINDRKHALLVDMHHIISDGTSMGILIKDFVELYGGRELEGLKVQYKDYSAWQRRQLEGDEAKRHEEYWKETLGGELPVLNLPADHPRPGVQSFEGERISFRLSKDQSEGLKELGKRHGATLYMTLLSVYGVLLSKYSGQEDIIVGSPVAGREHAELEGVMGMFVNTLALRLRPEGDKSYVKYLAEVKEQALGGYAHQAYPFDHLVELLGVKRDLSRNPVFDTMFALQNVELPELEIAGLKFRPYGKESKISKFDLLMEAYEDGEEIAVEIEYCRKLFDRVSMELFGEHFKQLAESVLRYPNKAISELEMMGEAERQRILVEFNDTKTDYPKDKTIHQLFGEQAKLHGEKTALAYQGREVSYGELDLMSNKIAHRLRESGVTREDIVGIMADRSVEMVAGILGILKAGGAYLPVDPEYPEDRIRYMLSDSRAGVLLMQKGMGEISNYPGKIIDIGDAAQRQNNYINIKNVNGPQDLAYIIYTSGSTGNPKGAMVEHGNVVRLVKNTNYISFSGEDRILPTGALVFDASTFEIWGALLNGLQLYLMDKETILDAYKLEEIIRKNRITILWLTSALFNQLAQENIGMFKPLKYLLVGGDVVSYKYVNELRRVAGDIKVINGYGPTENTTFSTCFLIEKDYEGSIPIGSPISNSTAYILNSKMKLQAIGVPGELYVGGDGVSRGYLNNEELTRERFVSNPYMEGDRLYKTGDVVRWLGDGNIEFIGRKDFQIKLRGFRIELGEIEQELLKHSGVKEAIVTAIGEGGEYRALCAYVSGEGELGGGVLRSHLSGRLPDYMVPSYFVQMDRLPLTSNGKVDRKALPAPEAKGSEGEYVAPRDAMEKALAEIWSGVLGIDKVGINDNFFALGGHSLKATVLSSRVHRGLGKELPLRKIFEQPTIEGQGRYLREQGTGGYSGIEVVGKSEHYPVSASQRRLYVLEQFGGIGTSYNMTVALEVEGDLDKERLEESFKRLVERHESLRTSFASVEGEPVQTVWEEVPFGVEYASGREEEIAGIAEGFVRPFDLGKAPLLRAKVVEINDRKHALLVDMHHIISDGTSMGILIKDFVELYGGRELEGLKVQYKDYSAWQRRQLEGDEAKRHEEYWKETLGGELPVLNLPADHPRPGVQSFEGERISFRLSKDQSEGLKELGKRHGATLYMTLLSVYGVLLSKYSGQEDIIVGSPVAGREHAELEGVMGMFVNTLALRLRPEGDKSYVKYLAEVKEQALGGYAHQAYPFDHLVELLGVKRDLSRNPVFDTMFALQNVELPELEIAGLKFRPYGQDVKHSQFDLTFEAFEEKGQIFVNVNYCRKLFDRVSMELFGEHFKQLAESVLRYPNKAISELEMMGEAERQRILVEFNDTKTDYPKDKTIHQLFGEQAKLHGEKTALAYQGREVSYGELDLMSNKIAHRLRESGVTREDIVGIMADRSVEMVAGILGILKAGGAYLPVDPEYPEDRIRYMLEDSRANIVLTQVALSVKASGLFDGRVVVIEEAATSETPAGAIEDINRPEDLCYVIYTSGTTGRPKGVMVEHRNVAAYIHAFTKTTGVNGTDVFIEQHAFTFDAFAEGLFGSLLNGATLVLPGKDQSQDLNGFTALIKKSQGTIVCVSPLFLSEMNKMPPIGSVHSYVCGGDILKWEYVSHLSEGSVIYNNYGPTEATISSTIYKCQNMIGGAVPIGRPIANYRIVMLDRWRKLNPVGIPGELCISGAGLARGYLGRPDLTGEKFTESLIWPGQRMYRTGDLARWMPDGNIEFMGRIDQQVKIRGYRIELGEIETQLLKHPDARECAVLALDDESGEKYLCAYICAGRELTAVELRRHLSVTLPDHMIPQAFVQLDRLPLTTHGKLDRESLKKTSDRMRSGIEFQEPSTETEKDIAEAWERILFLEKVSVNDDYFVLGGDSIKAVKLVSLLSNKYKVTLTDIFENRTIKKLADVLASRKHDLKQSFDRVRRETAEQDGDRNGRVNRSLEEQASKYRAYVDEETGLDIDAGTGHRNILLTGATGYLGIYLLRELLKKSDGNITLLLRAGDHKEAEERLNKKWAHYFGGSLLEKDRARIRVLSGDLAAGNLGLDPKEYQVLSREIDCIIHSAAYTKHFGEYQAFYRGNIAATRNLLDLAKTGRRKVFNHISTTSVGSGKVQGREAVLFTEYLGDIGQQIDGYYARSKLEAEKLVMTAGSEGMDFNIFRAGNLTFDSATGGFQENIGDNAFYIMLRSFIRLGVMPDLDIRNVDLTFVDQAAQAIVEMSGKKGLLNRCHHIMNDNYISVKDIAGRFAGNGIQIEVLPVPLFLDALEEKSRDERHRDDVSNILIHSNLLEETQTTYFDVTCIGTSAILKRLGFRWEEPGQAQFSKMLDHCRKVRFI